MKKRMLGKGGLEVSEIGFGSMGISFALGKPMEKGPAIALLRNTFERGITFFDTALLTAFIVKLAMTPGMDVRRSLGVSTA